MLKGSKKLVCITEGSRATELLCGQKVIVLRQALSVIKVSMVGLIDTVLRFSLWKSRQEEKDKTAGSR